MKKKNMMKNETNGIEKQNTRQKKKNYTVYMLLHKKIFFISDFITLNVDIYR